MGAIDLVVQIETPPSVASAACSASAARATRRAPSRAASSSRSTAATCSPTAALTRAMQDGAVEATRIPHEPARRAGPADRGHLRRRRARRSTTSSRVVRRAAPFARLPRAQFEGVLDMLSGRYPSDEFAELRPRLTWDRLRGRVRPREGAQRLAVANAGTIPDRGLYGVFLADGGRASAGKRERGPAGGRARRGDGLREPRGRGLRAGRLELAHRRDHARPRAGRARARRARARCRSGRATAPARPVELGALVGRLTRELAAARAEAPRAAWSSEHALDGGRGREPARVPARPDGGHGRRCPTTARSCSSARATRWATGACACSRRWGGRVHAPWALALQRAAARRAARPRWRRSGATTAS